MDKGNKESKEMGKNKENQEKINGNKKQTVIDNIKHNYQQIEQSIVEQLYMKQDLHGLTTGNMREDVWGELFEMVLPQKFAMEQSVFIIDSKENVSREVDLAIIDKTYTPYIFRYGRIKFIPIEAVAAVIQCKSQTLDGDKIIDWCESIEKLHTAGNSIARLATDIAVDSVPTQQSTRPIRILCGLSNSCEKEIKDRFDFVLLAVKGEKEQRSHLDIKVNESFRNLWEWYQELNLYHLEEEKKSKVRESMVKKWGGGNKIEGVTLDQYRVSSGDGKDISLLTFNFQLNQLLMLINNPMLFPHREYVKMFQGGE